GQHPTGRTGLPCGGRPHPGENDHPFLPVRGGAPGPARPRPRCVHGGRRPGALTFFVRIAAIIAGIRTKKLFNPPYGATRPSIRGGRGSGPARGCPVPLRTPGPRPCRARPRPIWVTRTP